MIHAILESNLFQQCFGSSGSIRAVGGNERRGQHVLKDRTLRQQTVVLKDESDLTISECRELLLIQFEWILSVNGDRAACWWFQRSHQIQQSAFAATGWTHDRNSVTFVER